jgi:uncharacterized protein (TIGR02271 family)
MTAHEKDTGSTPPDSPRIVEALSIGTIPVIEESLAVHKTVVDAGGVRLRKQVLSDEVTFQEPLLRESVNVRRIPIGRDVEGPQPVRYEGNVTVIPIVEERLIVRRQMVLVEEVHISKSQMVDRSSQSATVRHEELIIERQDPATGAWHIEPNDVASSQESRAPPSAPSPEK